MLRCLVIAILLTACSPVDERSTEVLSREQLLQQQMDSLLGVYESHTDEFGQGALQSLSVMCDTVDGSFAELIGSTLVDRLLSDDLQCRSMADITACGQGL